MVGVVSSQHVQWQEDESELVYGDTALVEFEEDTPTEIAARIQVTITGLEWQQTSPAEWAFFWH